MSSKSYPSSANFKGFLFIVAVLLAMGLLFYTDWLVEQLRADARKLVELYRESIIYLTSDESVGEFSFIFEEIIKDIDFPLVQTDADGQPVTWRNLSVKPDDLSAESVKKVKNLIKSMNKGSEPISIEYQSQVLGYIYYGDSDLIKQLQWLPYLEIIVATLFIFIGYFGFSNVKRSEQRSIWVGMAKETAHQLGTPISSLMGWLELLRTKTKHEIPQEVVSEMEKDIMRLNKVASRFSKIGSKANVEENMLNNVLHNVVEYFQRRLPQMGKEIEIIEMYEKNVCYNINPDLFEWVVENLIKNSWDAIEQPPGKIEVKLYKQNGQVIIDVKDNGKGVELNKRKDIFRPGYSTKKRGWGLGLSLAKRIIEEIHDGKLILKETRIGKGTTMRILLKR